MMENRLVQQALDLTKEDVDYWREKARDYYGALDLAAREAERLRKELEAAIRERDDFDQRLRLAKVKIGQLEAQDDPYRERVEALEALLVCDGTSILEDRVKDLIEVRDALKEAAKHQRLRAEKAEAELADLVRFRPFSEYGDDDGDVLWWALPVCEPPFFLGAPSNIGWPWTEEPPTNVYWTPLPKLTSDGSEIRGEA